jgi:hypothetical protein
MAFNATAWTVGLPKPLWITKRAAHATGRRLAMLRERCSRISAADMKVSPWSKRVAALVRRHPRSVLVVVATTFWSAVAALMGPQSALHALSLFFTSLVLGMMFVMQEERRRDNLAAQLERDRLNRSVLDLESYLRTRLLDQMSALSEQVEKLESSALRKLGAQSTILARRAREELETRRAFDLGAERKQA